MKIRFIYPRFEKFADSGKELAFLSTNKNIGNFQMPPALGIPILAALTPSEYEYGVFDENIEEIDYNDDSALIAISFFTPQANFAYRIASRFKEKGKTVIAGGMHPTLMKDEAAKYFDAVCIGEVENVWLDILNDFQNQELKQFYYGSYPDLSKMPVPERDIFKDKEGYDWQANLVQVMRGCAYNCESCIIPIQCGEKFRFRPIQNIINDIESIKCRELHFTDDTIVLPNKKCYEFVQELMKATSKLEPKPRIFISGSFNMHTNPEYLKMLVDGGVVCVYIVCGCDPFSIKAFQRNEKRFFEWGIEIVKNIHDAGLNVYISYGLGFDFQDKYVFDASLEFSRKANIDTAEFYISTPFPQTPSWHRLRKENRILHYNWTKYNTANVVFKPKNFTEQELNDGYVYCWKEFYKEHKLDRALNVFRKSQ